MFGLCLVTSLGSSRKRHPVIPSYRWPPPSPPPRWDVYTGKQLLFISSPSPWKQPCCLGSPHISIPNLSPRGVLRPLKWLHCDLWGTTWVLEVWGMRVKPKRPWFTLLYKSSKKTNMIFVSVRCTKDTTSQSEIEETRKHLCALTKVRLSGTN